MVWWIVIVAVVVAVGVALLYNRLVQLRNRVDNAWSQVDVQLKRRYDLVPNLVETVTGYASHEQETLRTVIEARRTAEVAEGPEEQSRAENALTGALRRLFALAESYPDLKAAPNFAELQTQLDDTENRIAVARQIYNDSTLTYNNAVQTIPTNLVAAVSGFRTRPYFDAGPEADTVPEVEF